MASLSDTFALELTRLIPRLSRYAQVLTHKKQDSDDLLQTTLERALSRRKQFKNGTQLDRWVFTIQSSIWKNELRARSTRLGQGLSDTDNLIDETSQSSLERTFLLNQVFNWVMELPEHQREVILLVYVEGFQYHEAADILDIPLGTLMSRLARARTNLSKCVSDSRRKITSKAKKQQ